MSNQTTIKNILFPTDFSKLSGNALVTAIAISKRQGATLHVVHVVDNRYFIVPHEANNSTIYLVPELEESARESLKELADFIWSEYNMQIKTYIETGHPADCIGKKAVELNCELIVMGTHGASGLREFFIGSNAYSVIKNTSVPVLTVPGKRQVKDFKKILFPIRATKGVTERYDFIEPIIEKNNAELIIAGLSQIGEVYKLDMLNEEIKELGISLRIHDTAFKSGYYVCKNYANKVLELAKREKVDLIVITASLDYKWRQFFIGPYAQQVVNHATVPVLSIRTFDTVTAFNDAVKEETIDISGLNLAF